MFPYLAMLSVPSGIALSGKRADGLPLWLIGLIYFLMIGFRFHVGMDWNNYVDLFQQKQGWGLSRVLISREPGYGLLVWISARLGWKIIFINAVSALVFCWGFFTVAKRCREPWIAVVIATPLLVVAFAMSGVRQALAAGIIFHLIAHWENRRTLTRLLQVVLASSFHFSAVFMMIFVALGSNTTQVIKIGSALVIAVIIVALVRFSPESVEAYSRLYVSTGGQLTAPGAIFQVGPLAAAGIIYLVNHDAWARANGDSPLIRAMAWAAVIAVPAILASSVGAYRFGLYLWPMAMAVYGGVPSTINNGVGRLFYRICLVAAGFALLVGWLLLANNSRAWLPYQNWLFQPDGVSMWRRHVG